MAITYRMRDEDPEQIEQMERKGDKKKNTKDFIGKADNLMVPPEARNYFKEKERNQKYLDNMKKLRERGKLG